MIRVVVDVNVIVSAVLASRGTPPQVLVAWDAHRFFSITSEGIVATVEEKLADPDIGGAYGITAEDILWVRALLRTQSQVVVVPVSSLLPVTNDPEDDYVLATSLVGQANYLVTGDKGLLRLGRYHDVVIVNPRAFLDSLAQENQ